MRKVPNTGGAAPEAMDEREAKKQLRKEKNRASAAASRARREAYTASLEEEVRPHILLASLAALSGVCSLGFQG